MRRFLSTTFNVAALLSLVLAATIAIESAKSYWISDDFDRWSAPDANDEFTEDNLFVVCGRARISHAFRRHWPGSVPTEPATRWIAQWTFVPGPGDYDDYIDTLKFTRVLPGLRVHKEIFTQSLTNDLQPLICLEVQREACVNLWLIVAACSVLPAVWLRRRRRPTRRGLCPSCGYDLRATPDRCPECGTVITAPRSSE